MSKETVNRIIKSCIVSRKGGVLMGEIENDYKELVGQGIPYISLGYKSLQDFIRSIDFVNVKTNHLGDSVLFVSDPKVAHIESLVSKQKNSSNRNVGSNKKRNRKNRYGKSRQGNNKFVPQNRTPARSCNRHYENKNRDNNYRPENFRRNTQMEYQQSKWYTDRPRDSWKNNRYEERKLNRFNNFNAARTSMQSSSKNSTLQTDNSWGARTISPSSMEENMYNFNSPEEKRYAQESRSWRFQFNVADNENSTVGRRSQGRSQRETYENSPQYNFYFHNQRGGGPTNNSNQSWRDQWHYNPYRDNQNGIWWPGLRGSSNTQFTWIGGRYSQNYPEIVIEPLLNGDQLIGDDFFLQLAIKNIKAVARKPRAGSAIRCGLCISGQTIDECRQRLEETQFLSGRIAILLGAVDIFRGHSLEKMVSDMKKLLDVCRNKFKLSDITLCTIPPLANYSVRFNLRKLSVLYSFNNWIKLHSNFSPDDSYIHHYNVIDLFSRFTDSNYRTLYNYFQIDARLVSGCPYPHVLWNTSGRRTAISMLQKK